MALAGNLTSSLPTAPFIADTSAVRINICWFTSLTLSLTAVLVGILCKQWLREYQRYEGLTPKDAFPIRQMRYEGLLGWNVPMILASLPLLLQAALVLFLSGLLDLLWTLHPTVASVVSAVVGIAMLFLVGSTVLPSLQYFFHFSGLLPNDEPRFQCAYKSPQSWAFHLLSTWLVSLYGQLVLTIFGGTAANYLQLSIWFSDANWVKYDVRWDSRTLYRMRHQLD